ncbi:hypothetical protein D3C81_2079530 [compost metagenome]
MSVFAFQHLRLAIVLDAKPLNQAQLSLQPVDMPFLIGQNLFHQIAADVIMDRVCIGDTFPQVLGTVQLQGQIGPQHLFDIFADIQLAEILQVR